MTSSNPVKISVFSSGAWGRETPMKCCTDCHYGRTVAPMETSGSSCLPYPWGLCAKTPTESLKPG